MPVSFSVCLLGHVIKAASYMTEVHEWHTSYPMGLQVKLAEGTAVPLELSLCTICFC